MNRSNKTIIIIFCVALAAVLTASLLYADSQNKKEEAAVIGDRLYTDIACGVNAGISSIFVLSGEGTMEDLEKSDVKPEFVYDNIRAIYEDLQ